MSIGRIFLLAARFVTGLIELLRNRQCEAAGEAKADAKSLKEQTRRVSEARAARRAVDVDRMPDNDPFRRD
jgi:predicted aminopeptidase